MVQSYRVPASMVLSTDVEVRISAALRMGEVRVRLTQQRECCSCGRPAMVQDAQIATGLPIYYEGMPEYKVKPWVYQPSRGEVLKNHYMACAACGFEQAS